MPLLSVITQRHEVPPPPAHQLREAGSSLAPTVIVTLENSTTNTTAESMVCSQLLTSTTVLQIQLSSTVPPGQLFILPSCISGSTSLLELVVQSVIVENILSLPPQLTRLSMQYCRIGSGSSLNTIDWSLFFNRYSTLENLSLTFSKLTGSLPFSVPSTLLRLILSSNAFSGSIPSTLMPVTSSTKALYYALSNNLLTGRIPENLFQPIMGPVCAFSSIQLILDFNRLTGPLPSTLFESCSQTTTTYFSASSNSITGSLDAQQGPQFFPNCTSPFNLRISL